MGGGKHLQGQAQQTPRVAETLLPLKALLGPGEVLVLTMAL